MVGEALLAGLGLDLVLDDHLEPFPKLLVATAKHHQPPSEDQIVESGAVHREPDDFLRRFAIMPGGHDEPSVFFLVRDVEGREHEGEVDSIIPESAVVAPADRATTAGGDELLTESEALLTGGAAGGVLDQANEGFADADLLG